MSKAIQLLIADDHQLFIAGIRELLSESNEIEVTGEANNGKELLKLLSLFPADIILLDVSMPEMNGKEACQIIKKDYPKDASIKAYLFNVGQDTLKLEKLSIWLR